MTVSFETYLHDLGKLYVEGVEADVHPGLLGRLGGALALAGRDANWIRYERNGLLGVGDLRRDPDEVHGIALERWHEHRTNILQMVDRGVPPSQAVERYMESRGTVPHTERQQETMLADTMGNAGRYSAWYYDLAAVRQQIERGNDVMTDTFGGVTATAYLVATADDWQNAKPEEWDRALTHGETAVRVGEFLDAAAGVSDGRQRQRSESSPVHSSRSDALDDLNIDAALDEDAPYSRSTIHERGRSVHQSGVRAGQPFESLDGLTEELTPAQRHAASRIINRMPRAFQDAWRARDNELAQRRNSEVRQLWREGRQDEARELARTNYDNYRDRFWTRVRNNPRLRGMLEEAGLEFPEGSRNAAPFWRLPDGSRETLSLDHTSRVTDAPWMSTDASELRMVTARENSSMLEFIRDNDPFQAPPVSSEMPAPSEMPWGAATAAGQGDHSSSSPEDARPEQSDAGAAPDEPALDAGDSHDFTPADANATDLSGHETRMNGDTSAAEHGPGYTDPGANYCTADGYDERINPVSSAANGNSCIGSDSTEAPNEPDVKLDDVVVDVDAIDVADEPAYSDADSNYSSADGYEERGGDVRSAPDEPDSSERGAPVAPPHEPDHTAATQDYL